jgi:hypothetical protein
LFPTEQGSGAKEELKLVPPYRARANYEATARYFVYGKKLLAADDEAALELQENQA